MCFDDHFLRFCVPYNTGNKRWTQTPIHSFPFLGFQQFTRGLFVVSVVAPRVWESRRGLLFRSWNWIKNTGISIVFCYLLTLCRWHFLMTRKWQCREWSDLLFVAVQCAWMATAWVALVNDVFLHNNKTDVFIPCIIVPVLTRIKTFSFHRVGHCSFWPGKTQYSEILPVIRIRFHGTNGLSLLMTCPCCWSKTGVSPQF